MVHSISNRQFRRYVMVKLAPWLHYCWQQVKAVGIKGLKVQYYKRAATGERGKRYALPNSSIMIHQPSGGAAGQASDIAIHAREILRVRERLNRIYQKHTGIRDIETIGMYADKT